MGSDSLIVLDAFDSNLSLIGSATGGIAEWIKSNENGLLLEPGNTGELNRYSVELFNNLDKSDRMRNIA